ncbi:MAG: cell division ATP-binding protein FtsE [Candidatus Spechtbacteria bacterium RIFCSPHIGHO2_02_FULL_43_15b]|nr:MAG: cell division ATP-binding protein FtsE [Candidatus Spechtbacteria bacterium RIFCSPHIGHO2_02_FULL_43_15b]
MIEFHSVSKIYGEDYYALNNVSLNIGEKEFVSVVGRSGAGKSTLIKLLLKEEAPTKGRVLFKGVDVVKLKGNSIMRYRRRIGAIFQDFRLLPSKNVYENIAFAMEAGGRTKEEIRSDVPQVIEIVGLKGKEENFPHELSGGEKQRVAVARALVQRPEVILADEPTGNLDPIHTWEIVKLLLKINEFGTAIVLATHDKDIVNFLKRRVVTLEDGKVMRDEKVGTYKI